MIETEKRLFTTREAAVYLGSTEKALAVMRNTGRIDIPVTKWGSRGVRYAKEDLDKWIEEHKEGK